MGATDFSRATDIVVVRARLKLLSTEVGGRQIGIRTGYRPNHVFERGNALHYSVAFVGEIQFDDSEEILPGKEGVVTVYFLKTLILLPLLTVGRKWWIYEGTRLVGVAKIISLQTGW